MSYFRKRSSNTCTSFFSSRKFTASLQHNMRQSIKKRRRETYVLMSGGPGGRKTQHNGSCPGSPEPAAGRFLLQGRGDKVIINPELFTDIR